MRQFIAIAERRGRVWSDDNQQYESQCTYKYILEYVKVAVLERWLAIERREFGMEAIYPITALLRDPASVKTAADKEVVRITERGVGAYVFCSEDVFRQRLQEAREQALLERDMAEAISEGLADFEHGRVYEGMDALREAIAAKRPDFISDTAGSRA